MESFCVDISLQLKTLLENSPLVLRLERTELCQIWYSHTWIIGIINALHFCFRL